MNNAVTSVLESASMLKAGDGNSEELDKIERMIRNTVDTLEYEPSLRSPEMCADIPVLSLRNDAVSDTNDLLSESSAFYVHPYISVPRVVGESGT